MAWHQHTGIREVEISLDGGEWQAADVSPGPTDDTWVQWALTTEVEPGDHLVKVRAIGKDGGVQTGVERGVLPDGATGHHEVDFSGETRLMTDFAEHRGAALVIGGSGGLGSSIARLLSQRGSHVA